MSTGPAGKRASGNATPDPKIPRRTEPGDVFSADNIAALLANVSFQEGMQQTISASVAPALQQHLPAAIAPLLQQHAAQTDRNIADAISPLQESIEKTNATLLQIQQKMDANSAMPVDSGSDARVDDLLARVGKIETTPTTASPGSGSMAGSGTTPGSGSAASGLNPWDRPLPRTLFTDQHLGPYEENSFLRQVRATSVAAPPTSTEFERALDHSIVKLSCKCMVAKSEVQKVAKTMCEEADMGNTPFEIEGPVTGQAFTLRFQEAYQSALLHSRKLLDAQRTGKAEWKRYQIDTLEAGSGGGVQQESLFLNPDKNNKQIKMEIAVRKVIQHLKRLHTDKRFMCTSREEGIIGCEFRPIVKVVALSPSSVSLQWNQAMVDRYAISKAEVQQEFDSDLGAGAGVQWS